VGFTNGDAKKVRLLSKGNDLIPKQQTTTEKTAVFFVLKK
jgi:hypothetical protein